MSRFQILSLSGGGYSGLYTAQVLRLLEARADAPLGQRFDLICGTSIGGLLALGLAFETPMAKIVEQFERHGEEIFPRRGRSIFGVVQRLISPAYSDGPLRAAISDIIGVGRRLGEAAHPVLIPVVSVTKGAPQIFKTPHHPNFGTDWKLDPIEVALATSAAPTIFPLAQIGDNLYADGGLFANSPALLGIHEARTFFSKVRDEEIHVLSVGATTRSFSIGHAAGRNLGLLGWGRHYRLLRVAMASQQRLVEYMAGHALGDRYFRVDADQSEEQSAELGLDRADSNARKTLKAMATNSVQAVVNDHRLTAILKHTPRKVHFFHGPKAPS